jgi:DNA-binding PadR family transcriptional regulator
MQSGIVFFDKSNFIFPINVYIYRGKKMRMISRIEEIILLSIWRLQDNAYGITISEEVVKATGKTWLTGSIYASLSRLLKHGLVVSIEGEPTAERGGRRKIYYKLTPEGQRALLAVRRVNSIIWSDLPSFEVKE